MVADNDYALGLLVQALSHSRYWKEMAIFVVEDDAQAGPDHVDAHRSVALVISPYARRRIVDSTFYTTCSMIRTMELILGLPPISQYSASANPMFACFTSKPDFTPYWAEKPRVPLDERNLANVPNAELSKRIDLTKEDSVPDQLFNRIVWESMRPGEPMPPPVHSVASEASRLWR